MPRLMLLDPRKLHENNPECPGRLILLPTGAWCCFDCGAQVPLTGVEVAEVHDPSLEEAEALGREMAQQINETLKAIPYKIQREQAPSYTISEVQPVAVVNARAVKPRHSIKEMMEMVKTLVPQETYNMGAPVDGFDRESVMNYCCDSNSMGTTNPAARWLQPGVLCRQEFRKGEEPSSSSLVGQLTEPPSPLPSLAEMFKAITSTK